MRAEPSEAAFAAGLLDPHRPAPAGFGTVEAARRYGVYRNNVVVGLVDALEATYPAVAALVGRDFFRAAAREHVRAAPPRSPVLIDYGGGFPEFLAAFPPAGRLPWLADVARLEWARTRAYNAADAEPADLSLLATIPPEALPEARLALHPSVVLVRSRWSVATIWSETMRRAETRSADVARPETALVLRPADAVIVTAAPPGDDAFLEAVAAGATIADAAEAAAPHPGFDLSEAFARLFAAGLFAAGLFTGIAAPSPGSPAP